MPSSVESFRSMCVSSTSLCGSESGSTAKLWLWAVISTLDVFCRSLRRTNCDFASLSAQFAQDVLLDSVVVRDHVKAGRFVLYSHYFHWLVRALADFPHVRAIRGHDLREIRPVHLGNGAGFND